MKVEEYTRAARQLLVSHEASKVRLVEPGTEKEKCMLMKQWSLL